MANARTANKILIDSTGEIIDTGVKIAHILFTPNANNDELLLRETATGADCFYLRGAVAKQTEAYSFEICPLVFANGVYVQTITSGAKAVLVTTQAGSK